MPADPAARRRRSALVFSTWVLCLGLWASATPARAATQGSVLVIYSYDQELPWTQELHRGLLAGFSRTPEVELLFEHMDAKRWPNLEHFDGFVEHLSQKFAERQPDVLVLADDPIFDRLYPRRDEIFPDVPIVFMGLNRVREALTGGVEGVTGVFELHSTEETVEEALALTEADGIVVINDTSQTGQANEATLTSLQQRFPTVDWHIYRDLVDDNLEILEALPEDWPILVMLPLRRSRADGPMLPQSESVKRLRDALPNPLFYDAGWLMGSGIVGGHLLLGDVHAERAAEMALALLEGALPRDIPAELTTGQEWIFDARELERFGWRDRVPEGAKLLFEEQSFWSRHGDLILATTAIALVAALIISLLVMTIAAQRRAESKLRAQQARLLTALSANNAGVFEVAGTKVHYSSDRWTELLGAEQSSRLADWKNCLQAPGPAAFQRVLDLLAAGEGPQRLELRVNSTPERILDVLMASRQSATGDPRIVGVAQDVTQARHQEDIQSRQQRLSALGELAGGIAHDFNNILTVINVSSELLTETDDLSDVRSAGADIHAAGMRAADLVQQLMVFGRAKTDPTQRLDLSESVRSLHQFLNRLIGEQHEVVSLLADKPVGAPLSSAHADQVFSNLVLNARDAMPQGGAIHVETRVEHKDGIAWSVLVVADSGRGMDEATIDRIFEPFFTTKRVGEGTGLGLSTVYGIVQATGGTIDVDSSPGAGTRFEIRWPQVTLGPEHEVATHDQPKTADGASILLVEDEANIADLTRRILEQAGYSVETAVNGREGLEISRRGFDLVLTDVVLPRLSGPEMADAIRSESPVTKIGFMSGYAHHPTVSREVSDPPTQILGKPFSRAELLEFVSTHL